MGIKLSSVKVESVIVYHEDKFIFLLSPQYDLERSWTILSHLKEADDTLKLNKCAFPTSEIHSDNFVVQSDQREGISQPLGLLAT